MNANQDNPERQIEALMRQWGAEESVRDQLPPAPMRVPAATTTGGGWRPWARSLLTAAAAVVLLVGGVAIGAYLMPALQAMHDQAGGGETPPITVGDSGSSPGAEPAEPTSVPVPVAPVSPATDTELARARRQALQATELAEALSKQLDQARRESAAERRRADDADRRFRQAGEDLTKAESLALKQRGEKVELVEEVTRLRNTIARLHALSSETARAAELKSKLELAEADLARKTKLLAERETEYDGLRKRLGEYVTQLDEVQKAIAAAEARKDNALEQMQKDLRDSRELAAKDAKQLEALRSEISTLQAQTRLLEHGTREAYLALAAPEADGLAAMKQAARRARLLERVGELHRESPEDVRDLLDRLEVSLTRLAMLDPDDVAGVQAWKQSLDTDTLAVRARRTALSAQASSAVRVWLLEASIILSGAEDVL